MGQVPGGVRKLDRLIILGLILVDICFNEVQLSLMKFHHSTKSKLAFKKLCLLS